MTANNMHDGGRMVNCRASGNEVEVAGREEGGVRAYLPQRWQIDRLWYRELLIWEDGGRTWLLHMDLM